MEKSKNQKWRIDSKRVFPSYGHQNELKNTHRGLAKQRDRYARAGKEHKTKIINELVELFDYHRMAASRALQARGLHPLAAVSQDDQAHIEQKNYTRVRLWFGSLLSG